MDATAREPQPGSRSPGAKAGRQLKRLGLLVAMSVTTINVWTGSPLMALWVGSRLSSAGTPTMTAFLVFFLTMGAISLVLIKVLGYLGATYDQLVGRKPAVRRHTAWLRAMSGDRPHEQGAEYRLSALDVILVVSVVLAVVAFEVWFFFYSGSPIDGRSGRH